MSNPLPPVKNSDFRTFAWRTDPNLTERIASTQVESILRNKEQAEQTVDNSLQFLRKVSSQLLATDLEGGYCEECKRSGPSAESLGKTFSYVAKTVDEITRLMEFAAGRADSRQESVGFADLARYLTNEQFAQVMKWVGENQTIDVSPP